MIRHVEITDSRTFGVCEQELNQRAQGEVTIREALRELDLWGAGAVFALTEYEDSGKHTLMLIKDWKDLVNQVCEACDQNI